MKSKTMRYSDGYSDLSLRNLSGLNATYFTPFCLVFLSSERGLHHLDFLRVKHPGCCEKSGVLIGFSVALVGSNLNCILQSLIIHCILMAYWGLPSSSS